MAAGNYTFNDSTHGGRLLRSAISQFEAGYNALKQVQGCMIQSLSSGSPQVQSFLDFWGFPDMATAQAAYDEFSSMMGKITTDASVSSVQAALNQAFNKFR